MIGIRGSTASIRLRTYLNDHLAGAGAGIALCARAAANNEGTPLGSRLRELLLELEADEATLRDVMRRLDVGVAAPKRVAALAGERIGRLKLNGQLVGYSPLSRIEELEGLAVGIEGKRRLWLALEAISDAHPALAGIDFAELARRADRQRDVVDGERLDAVQKAFSETEGRAPTAPA